MLKHYFYWSSNSQANKKNNTKLMIMKREERWSFITFADRTLFEDTKQCPLLVVDIQYSSRCYSFANNLQLTSFSCHCLNMKSATVCSFEVNSVRFKNRIRSRLFLMLVFKAMTWTGFSDSPQLSNGHGMIRWNTTRNLGGDLYWFLMNISSS